MALALYSRPHESAKFSSTRPFTITFDGRIGGLMAKKVYIRNDDTSRWYNNITLLAYDSEGDNIVDGSKDGFEWKLLEKDIAPKPEEWRDVVPGNTLSLGSNLGNSTFSDTITFLPVWVQVKIPRGQSIKVITDVFLRLQATENVI